MKEVHKILFISLSNIGDCILTLPALDTLRNNFPEAKIHVMCGTRPKEIFENAPFIEKLIVYDKYAGLKEKIKLFHELKKERFDLVIDLRNTLYGILLPAKYKNSFLLRIPRNIMHMKDRHLYKLRMNPERPSQAQSLYKGALDRERVDLLLKQNNAGNNDKIFVIASGARSHIKRWPKEGFVELIPDLIKEFQAKVVLVGDKDDIANNKYIAEQAGQGVIDLTAKTSIAELACLLEKADCVITNDSATLHLASYLNRPSVAIFGPTNELKYGPWSLVNAVVKKDIVCRPCEKAQCGFGHLKCMQLIKKEDVLKQVRKVLSMPNFLEAVNNRGNFKRILIVRTDRIGDVLLSSPAIKALRDNYPAAYIAIMVTPYAKDIVEDNPYLDEVITYDKEGKHKKWRRSAKFAQHLSKKGFDLALILHPTNRAHLVTFFAGIPRRIGYDRKLGFLLTDRIKHAKQFGEKHELEYSLDLLRPLGIAAEDKNLYMPIKQASEAWADELLKGQGIRKSDRLLAVHPGASCKSKIWPNQRFAAVADKLIKKFGFKVLLIAGPKDIALADSLVKNMQHPAINLAGKTSVSQLASLLKRCDLLISNDSGPVHIATAVGVPVISIFGRSQKGLSPKRWGPVGAKDKVIHKEVGCVKCLAHDCKRDFACLKAISVDDVLAAAESILNIQLI